MNFLRRMSGVDLHKLSKSTRKHIVHGARTVKRHTIDSASFEQARQRAVKDAVTFQQRAEKYADERARRQVLQSVVKSMDSARRASAAGASCFSSGITRQVRFVKVCAGLLVTSALLGAVGYAARPISDLVRQVQSP